MSGRAKLAAAVYVALGVVLAAIGLLLALGANLGLVSGDPVRRLAALAVGFALVFVGAHISAAGLKTLRAPYG